MNNIQYAPVVPISIAETMFEEGCLGDYHLLLAHDVVKYPDDYVRIYEKSSNFIILDNSVVELGKAVDVDMIAEAYRIIRPDVIVLPDVYLKGKDTVESTLQGLEALINITPKAQFMALPQGETFKDWIICAEKLTKESRIDYWGIPRNVRQDLKVSRVIAAQVLSTFTDKCIHMFGFSDSLLDDILSTRQSWVMGCNVIGIDSNVPVRMGCNDQVMSLSQSDPGPRRDWWDNPGLFTSQAKTNVQQVRAWLNK